MVLEADIWGPGEQKLATAGGCVLEVSLPHPPHVPGLRKAMAVVVQAWLHASGSEMSTTRLGQGWSYVRDP
jgi:hypothetical protein